MKKFILILIAIFLIAPLAQAATIYSEYNVEMAKYKSQEIAPLTIKADLVAEVTAANGINLLLDPERWILWDKTNIFATGTAVDNGHISANITPIFSNDYKILHISVLSDWQKNDTATFTGLKLRSYSREMDYQYIGLDITGDNIADFQDINKFRVTSNFYLDVVPPYPVSNLTYTVNEDKTQVHLSWLNPPDYDLASIVVEKILTRDGITGPVTEVLSGTLDTNYTDNNVKPNDKLIYRVYGRDRANIGEITEVVIDLNITEQPGTPPPTETTPPPPTTQTDELTKLNSLYGYYKIRYAIKCNGTTSETNSMCLWAKIDLVYTQQKIGKSDIQASLSARDIELMKTRIVWSEARYQEKCVNAETPDKTCPALKKSLDRVHYFID